MLLSFSGFSPYISSTDMPRLRSHNTLATNDTLELGSKSKEKPPRKVKATKASARVKAKIKRATSRKSRDTVECMTSQKPPRDDDSEGPVPPQKKTRGRPEIRNSKFPKDTQPATLHCFANNDLDAIASIISINNTEMSTASWDHVLFSEHIGKHILSYIEHTSKLSQVSKLSSSYF